MRGRLPCILAVGHGYAATGFSRVMHSLLPELATRFEVHHLAPNYPGPTVRGSWTIHGNRNPVDVWAVQTAARLIEELRPQIVLVLQSPLAMTAYTRALGAHRARARLVTYCGIDGRLLAPQTMTWMGHVDRLVVYTEFARAVVEECIAHLQARSHGMRGPRLAVIPHGTSTELFRPVPDGAPPIVRRERARRALFNGRAPERDAFVVLNASRNQPRKRIDLTIEGFARFARGKPDVRLYLHMGTREVGWDVLSLAARHGIAERVLLTTRSRQHPEVDAEHLNLIYNACDVGVNTASGEGWGLAAFEHAGTGAAQVLPRHTACEELWQGSAVFVDPVRIEPMGRHLEASVVSPEGVAGALERLYRNRGFLEEMSWAAYLNATQHSLSWASVARRWTALLEAVLDD